MLAVVLAFPVGTVPVLAAAGVDSLLTAGRVRPGVSVGGVDLSRLERGAARDKLAAAAAALDRQPLEVSAGDTKVKTTRSEAGLRVDVEASLASALAVGSGGLLDADKLRTWLGEVPLPWQVRIDADRVSKLLDAVEKKAQRPAREPDLKFEGVNVELVAGQAGTAVDRPAARAALAAASANPGTRQVRFQLVERAPSVGADAAAATLEQAKRLVGAVLTVAAAGTQATIEAGDLSTLLDAKPVDGKLALRLDKKKLDALLREEAPFAYVPARDASFQVEGGTPQVVPAADGRSVDAGKAAAALLAAGTASGGNRTVELPLKAAEPELTTEEAGKLGVKEQIGTFTTTFSSEDAPRVHNIGLIAEAMDGSVVLPGETFSMNATTGERTAAKGYRTANVIVNGELVPGLGGGVCQAGTTMFNAILEAGLPVAERRNHSLHISHYPLGRDATLNWPTTDVKFRNDSPYGIFITGQATSSTVRFTLYSTSRGYKSSYTTSERSNFTDPPVKYVDDPKLPKGTTEVKEPGAQGFDVSVTRTVTDGDGTVVRRDTFASHYRPWTRVVLRGTKPVENEPSGG